MWVEAFFPLLFDVLYFWSTGTYSLLTVPLLKYPSPQREQIVYVGWLSDIAQPSHFEDAYKWDLEKQNEMITATAKTVVDIN